MAYPPSGDKITDALDYPAIVDELIRLAGLELYRGGLSEDDENYRRWLREKLHSVLPATPEGRPE